MVAWILADRDGMPENINMFHLYTGYKDLGEDVKLFTQGDMFEDKIDLRSGDIVGGYINTCQHAMKRLGADIPAFSDYPEKLRNYSYMNRDVWQRKLSDVIAEVQKGDFEPFFMKSVEQKKINGCLIESESDLRPAYYFIDDDPDVWCSNPIEGLNSEWRCYIHHNKVVKACCYKGSSFEKLNYKWISGICDVLDTEDMPIAYSLDFGTTQLGDTILIEANDFYALGNYGLESKIYADLHRQRWHQICYNGRDNNE